MAYTMVKHISEGDLPGIVIFVGLGQHMVAWMDLEQCISELHYSDVRIYPQEMDGRIKSPCCPL